MMKAIFWGVVIFLTAFTISTLCLNWAIDQGFIVTAQFALKVKFGIPFLLGIVTFITIWEEKK